MDLRVLFLLAIVNIPLYPVLGAALYGNRHAFREAVTLSSLTDMQVWMHGGDRRTFWSDVLLGLFIGGCGALVLGEYRVLQMYFQL